ncbi:sarcoplasmic reticulum histidine-rich calcium-binding protein-like [Lethenteron reissneri]|uniref:sarcoplasmic reticulum histidine-rich calcium-binding protein-like n=1 Tax=Lethenteron reissneri TaxID=7753 RepID=UPI002AB5EF8E|nr:sarcoplasmic reticulum histidine-rich calcium-binding protein-like [Lethenteron reissneri]
MAVIMALIAVFIATVALSSTASSLPVSGKLSPSDEAALKCIIEVLSGALSPAQPPPAASAECMEILRGDNRISTLIHQHDLLSQLEEIAGRGPAGERAGTASTAADAKYEPSEERQETKEKEEVEDDEETRVDHVEKDKKDAKKKKQQQQENDDDDDEKEKEEEGGDDETKSGVGKSREFRTKGPGSAERRAGGVGGEGTKWSGGRVRVEPRHGEAPPEKATDRERSNGEEPRGQMHGAPDNGDEEEEEEEERSPHHEDKDDGVGDEVARSVGTGGDDDEVEEEDANVEEVTETPAHRGDAGPQRGSHGTSGVERSAARKAHDGRRRPAAEQLLEYLDQIRQRLGQKQQEQQEQEQQRRRGDYGGRHPDKGEPLAERKSDDEDDDDDRDDEKVEYETRKSEGGGRHGHDEVEDDAREQEEDDDRTDDDDEGEEQVGGEEVFGDGVGSSHRWAGKVHSEGRPAWGAAHRAAAKGDDGEEGDEEKEEQEEEVGRGGGKEWGGDKRAQDTQSRKHSTLNSKQLLELKAMEHELVKIAERLGERLG